jgi:hypothetical protein
MKILKHKTKDAGIAMLLSVMVVSGVLAIALGVSAIMIKEIEFNRNVWFNLPAFFAADAGIEQILSVRDNPVSICTSSDPCSLPTTGAQYWVVVTPNGGTKPDGGICNSSYYCVESTGIFQGTRRSVEANY